MFLNFLNSKESNVVIGASAETKHWAVPKANFPAGLPQDIEDAIVDEEQLAELEAMGGDSTRIDPNTYYVIDKVIDRKRLGKGVVTLKFFTGGNTKCESKSLNRQATAPDYPGALRDANPTPSQATAAAAGASPMAAPP